MKWNITKYNEWISLGRPINLEITELHIRESNIKTLEGIENLVNLQILNCSQNQLTSLQGIENLVNLQELHCHSNKLTSLQEMENLVNLQKLHCYHNKLTSLQGIENLVKLQYFGCSYNLLTSLQGIENLTYLLELDCSDNELTSLQGIQNLVRLQKLDCSCNQLTSLQQIENLANLQNLYCPYNRLTSLQGIQNLINLRAISHHNNPIGHIPPNILRILNRQLTGQNIYRDNQNVHNHQIQESIRTSVNNILQIKPTITNIADINNLILKDNILTEQTKRLLLEYSNQNDIYMHLNITFAELLLYVFNRIEINEHKDEIKQILNIEMEESICKCFTGRISRLVNCLNGFDPLVNIKIADSEQIAQIISIVRNELDANKNYSVELHRSEVTNRLIELGYDLPTINVWTENIE